MKVQIGAYNYYIDGFLKSNLDIAKSAILKDLDMIFAYDGVEGSGKSVKAMQDALYCDPDFNIDKMAFNPSQFRKLVFNAKPYSAIQYDEAYSGLSSRATMSLINRTLVSMLTEIRYKNLFIFVVLPCFFDLDRYVALWRSRVLIHIYMQKGFERGYFAFYNMDKKKELFFLGKKYYSYAKPTPNFRGRFTNVYTVDETEYRKRKKQSNADKEENRVREELRQEQRKELFERMVDRQDLPDRIKADIIGISEPTYYRWLSSWKDFKEIHGN